MLAAVECFNRAFYGFAAASAVAVVEVEVVLA